MTKRGVSEFPTDTAVTACMKRVEIVIICLYSGVFKETSHICKFNISDSKTALHLQLWKTS